MGCRKEGSRGRRANRDRTRGMSGGWSRQVILSSHYNVCFWLQRHLSKSNPGFSWVQNYVISKPHFFACELKTNVSGCLSGCDNLTVPKPGHTTGGSGRRGARRGGGVERGWAGRDADGSAIAQETTVPLALQTIEDNCPERFFGNTNK